jgi:Rrf2 family iron-sulfur cluster assembly transcriptional regulator
MLSQQSKYALRALIHLSLNSSDRFKQIETLAQETDLPAPYLSKVLKPLVKSGILVSKRGKNGGVRVNPTKDSITFYEICYALEDPIVCAECVLFKKPCNNTCPCPFHGSWTQTKTWFIDYLKATVVSSELLLSDSQSGYLHLKLAPHLS